MNRLVDGPLFVALLLASTIATACESTYDPSSLVDPTGKDPGLRLDRRQFPKYGGLKITEAQAVNDRGYLAQADKYFGGDRKRAASEIADRGWQYFRSGNADAAMSRWNQAWMLDNCNAKALWGFALAQYDRQKFTEATALMSEAERYVGDDADFLADKARLQSFEGLRTGNQTLITEAMSGFAAVYARAPQHVMNLQNWAIALFYLARYREAWEKIGLAEAAPRANELDRRFIAALQEKMPRP